MLANSSRISDITRSDTFQRSFYQVMLQYDENAVVQLFRLFNMLAVEVCSETGLFRHLTNRIFHSF